MKIPTPDEFAKEGGYNPFPGRWDRWLSAVRESILSAQPTAGRHVTTDEHPGKGTVINVERKRPVVTPPGECFCDYAECGGDEHTIYVTFSGITAPCACIDFTYVNANTSRLITSISLDGTIVANCSDGVWSGGNEEITFDYNSYADSTCGDLQDSNTATPTAILWCEGSSLNVALTDNISVMFYSEVCLLDTEYSSTLSCGQQFEADTIPPGAAFGRSIGCGEGGTVIVSLTPP